MPGIVERLTLRAARDAAGATPPADRARRAAALRTARQKARAADALFCDGHRAEAIALLAEAVEATLEAVDDARHAAILAARGISVRTTRDLLAALRSARDLEDGIGAGDAAAFQAALVARRRLADALALASLEPKALARRRARRVGALAGVALLAAALPFVPIPELTRVRVWSSGDWTYNAHLAADAVDGDPRTEWHAPDQTGGWLDIRVSPPVDMARLRVLNGHNPPFDDRGCAVAVIRLYRRGEEVASFSHRWRGVEADPAWVDFEVGQPGIDRIRIDVPVYHQMGVAIAEVGWE